MKVTKSLAACAAIAAVALTGLAASAGQEDRRAGMKTIGKSAKAISQGGDAVALAQAIVDAAKQIPVVFKDEEITGDSTALPLIWTQFDDFTAKGMDLEMAAMAVLDAAQNGGDVAAAAKKMGATCGSCHKMYRVKK